MEKHREDRVASSTDERTLNRLVLRARIAEAEPMRYTPAGMPAITVQLEHESQQSEAGQQREVKLMLKAVAFGVQAERLAQLELGSRWRFEGFLATPRQRKQIVLHIQDMQPDPDSF